MRFSEVNKTFNNEFYAYQNKDTQNVSRLPIIGNGVADFIQMIRESDVEKDKNLVSTIALYAPTAPEVVGFTEDRWDYSRAAMESQKLTEQLEELKNKEVGNQMRL